MSSYQQCVCQFQGSDGEEVVVMDSRWNAEQRAAARAKFKQVVARRRREGKSVLSDSVLKTVSEPASTPAVA